MNEVEKMYSNAGVECDLPCQKRGVECIDNLYCNPFTAEKQIELIKWLCKKDITDYNIINYFEGKYYCFYAWEEGFKESDLFEKYEEALACLFNYIWQDLTEEERKQIKNILESEVRE